MCEYLIDLGELGVWALWNLPCGLATPDLLMLIADLLR